MEQEDISLLELKQEDVAWLSLLATQAYSDHYTDTWYDNGAWYLQTYFSTTRLQEELQDLNARFYAIYYKGDPVGFIKLNIDKPLEEEPNALEVERIYLLKRVSGKGIGTFVIHFIFDLAQKWRKKLVWLKVMDTSPDAIRFYSKMGFEVCGTHQVNFAQKKQGMRGMYIMKKEL